MSFNYLTPRGLVYSVNGADGSSVPIGWTTETYTCGGGSTFYLNQTYDISDTVDSFTTAMANLNAALGSDPVPDLFAVFVNIHSVELLHGYDGTCDAGTSPEVAVSETLTVDSGWEFWDGTGALVSNVVVGGEGLSAPVFGGTADVDQRRLVNPSPTWPVPDVEGNTFGQTLFTADQIPTSIDFSLVGNGGRPDNFIDATVLYTFSVTIIGLTATLKTWMCVL